MGVLVFALAIMDNNKNSHLEVMKAEVPGQYLVGIKNTAQILYFLYWVCSSSLWFFISGWHAPVW